MKFGIGVVVAIVMQVSGFVWWTAQQALTIEELKDHVDMMSSRMAIEDQVNLKRDVQNNTHEIELLWEDVDMASKHMDRIVSLQQKVAILEKEIAWMQNPMH